MCGPRAPWTPAQGGLSHATLLGWRYVTGHDPSPAHAGGRVTSDKRFPAHMAGNRLPPRLVPAPARSHARLSRRRGRQDLKQQQGGLLMYTGAQGISHPGCYHQCEKMEQGWSRSQPCFSRNGWGEGGDSFPCRPHLGRLPVDLGLGILLGADPGRDGGSGLDLGVAQQRRTQLPRTTPSRPVQL